MSYLGWVKRRRLSVLPILVIGACLLWALALRPASAHSAPSRTAKPVHIHSASRDAGKALNTVTPVESCSTLGAADLTGIPGASTQINTATVKTASGGWSYCDVTGTIAPQDQFEVQLPLTTYTGRYLQDGCGGLCGSVSVSAPAAYSCTPLNNGEFVQASDDEGHTSGGGTFGENPELRADFGYLTEHQLAVVAKTMIRQFYGSSPSYSYFDGCSQGGHEGLTEAERYPTDFNGIIAGAPASITQELNSFYQPWLANVDWTADHTTAIMTTDQLSLLHKAVMAACAGADGQIDDPFDCHFKPSSIECTAQQTTNCLTAAQVDVVDKIYSGPVDGKGRRLYPGGEPYGSELAWAGWVIPRPGQTYTQTTAFSIGSPWLKFLSFPGIPAGSQTSVTEHARFTDAAFAQARKLAGLYDADNPDLSAFRAHGGRIIMWQGWADQAISPFGTTDFYTQMTKELGGLTATQRFARLFMLPGVFHCGGGSAPNQLDAVDAILNWVENGNAPTSLLATETSTTSPTTVVATRPIYPYPEISHYNGGDPNDASSYSGVPSKSMPTTTWLGHFPSAPALWCGYKRTDYVCRAHRGPEPGHARRRGSRPHTGSPTAAKD